MIVEAKGLEVRGYEECLSKKGNKYLIVRLEDETGKSYSIVDNDIEHASSYKKGSVYDFKFKLIFGRYTNVRISSFAKSNQES